MPSLYNRAGHISRVVLLLMLVLSLGLDYFYEIKIKNIGLHT